MSYAPAKKRLPTLEEMQENPKDVEAMALLEAAKRLQACKPLIESGKVYKENDPVFNAIRFNSELWTIFQTELFKKDHHLSLQMRKPLLEIARFMDKTTADLIGKPDLDIIDAIIEINRNVAAGLMKKEEIEKEAAQKAGAKKLSKPVSKAPPPKAMPAQAKPVSGEPLKVSV